MTNKDLFRALGDIDEDLVAALETERPGKKKTIRFWLSSAVAACLCVALLALALTGLPFGPQTNESTLPPIQMDGTTDVTHNPADLRESTTPPQESSSPTGEPIGSGGNAGIMGQDPNQITQDIPQDLTFRLTWPDGSYDSKTQEFTDSTGTYHVALNKTELARVWNLLTALGTPESADSVLPSLTWSYEGNTYTASGWDTQPLVVLVQDAANRVR